MQAFKVIWSEKLRLQLRWNRLNRTSEYAKQVSSLLRPQRVNAASRTLKSYLKYVQRQVIITVAILGTKNQFYQQRDHKLNRNRCTQLMPTANF